MELGMANLYKYIAIATGVLVVGMWLNNAFTVNRLETQLAHANNVILSQDSTIVVAEGLYERRGNEVASLRRVNKTLADSLPVLAERNKTLDRRLQSWTALVAHYEAIVDSGDVIVEEVTGASPSLSIEVTEHWGQARLFASLEDSALNASTSLNVRSKGIQIQYSLSSTNKTCQLIITHDPIPVDVIISQDSQGGWVGNVSLPPYLELSRFSLTTKKKRVSLLQRISLTVGITTHPALMTGLGYNGWSLGTILSDDTNYYLSRTVPLSWIFGRK